MCSRPKRLSSSAGGRRLPPSPLAVAALVCLCFRLRLAAAAACPALRRQLALCPAHPAAALCCLARRQAESLARTEVRSPPCSELTSLCHPALAPHSMLAPTLMLIPGLPSLLFACRRRRHVYRAAGAAHGPHATGAACCAGAALARSSSVPAQAASASRPVHWRWQRATSFPTQRGGKRQPPCPVTACRHRRAWHTAWRRLRPGRRCACGVGKEGLAACFLLACTHPFWCISRPSSIAAFPPAATVTQATGTSIQSLWVHPSPLRRPWLPRRRPAHRLSSLGAGRRLPRVRPPMMLWGRQQCKRGRLSAEPYILSSRPVHTSAAPCPALP